MLTGSPFRNGTYRRVADCNKPWRRGAPGAKIHSIEPPPGDHFLRLLAQLVDPKPHGITGFQVNRRRLASHAHARRRAGGDDVPRLERHEPADVTHQMR